MSGPGTLDNRNPVVHCNFALLLCTLLFSLSLSGPLLCGAAEYCVKPTEDTPCPGEPCETLMEYVQNATQYFTSNVTMKFLPGNHTLSQPMTVGSVVNFSLILEDSSQTHNSGIVCRNEGTVLQSGYLCFEGTQNLTIDGLHFYSCGQNPIQMRGACNELQGSLRFIGVINLKMLGTTVERSADQGIYAFNVVGTISIVRGNFVNNTGFAPHISMLYAQITPTVSYNGTTTINIEDTILVGNSGGICLSLNLRTPVNVSILNINATGMSDGPFSGLGIDVICNYEPCLGSSVYIGNSRISKYLSGGIRFLNTIFLKVFVKDTIIDDNEGTKGVVLNGAGLTMAYLSPMDPRLLMCSGGSLISSSKTGLKDSTASFSADDSSDTSPIIFENVIFSGNSFHSSFAEEILVPIVSIDVPTFDEQSLNFIECKFIYNNGSVVLLQGSSDVTFTNCSFMANRGSCILATPSNFTLSGTIEFAYNLAYKGGGLAFYGRSHMLVNSNTNIHFANSFATDVGGAIYVDSSTSVVAVTGYYTDSGCFIKLSSIEDRSFRFIFVNNTAENGGDDIYGGLVYPCKLSPNFTVDPFELINSTFRFEPPNTSISPMTSDPSRVCLCRHSKPDCLVIFSEAVHNVYPGQTLSLPAVVVGERFGAVTGSIYAQFMRLSNPRIPPVLGPLQRYQAAEPHKCTDLNYTILSSNDQEVLVLTIPDFRYLQGVPGKEEVVNDISNYHIYGTISLSLLSYPVFNNITLLPCPLGFMLERQPGRCVCDTQLQRKNITCNINDQTIHRGTLWVNASFNGNVSNGVIIGKYCPFDYCKSKETDVNLENPDIQCNFNHSGTLCGGCQANLSLALGSSQCLSCSNKYLALLVPFAIAGFALVFFIKLLNLTVSKGTINGLIFYANIVGAIPTIFFPAGASNPLTVFIAWLNLDLGIETCFFDGLNAYLKTWLQFVFPLYVWGIAGLIIVTSHYSLTAAKLFGNNSVPVLATLFLLSYTKLLRTIIAVIYISDLEYPGGTQLVWASDGNIGYLHSVHIPLFAVAVSFLLFLWLPYTIVLTVGQSLLKIRCVARLKPFFDAYYGPFKDKHYYWVGVLLVVRVLLLIIFAVITPNVTNPLVVCLTSFAILMYILAVGHVFKKWWLSLLENSFVLNLGVLSAATLYINSSGGNQAAVVNTSVGIAFAEFVGIVCFHVYDALMRRKKSGDNREYRGYEAINDSRELHTEYQQDFSNYREPLLGLDDN